MTIDFAKELRRMVEQNPAHILKSVVDMMVLNGTWQLQDKQVQAYLLLALARMEELAVEEQQHE